MMTKPPFIPVERDARRPDFRPGVAVRLADGQLWHFPAGRVDPETAALLELISHAIPADPTLDRTVRAYVAAAAALLLANYDLGPDAVGWLLVGGFDDL